MKTTDIECLRSGDILSLSFFDHVFLELDPSPNPDKDGLDAMGTCVSVYQISQECAVALALGPAFVNEQHRVVVPILLGGVRVWLVKNPLRSSVWTVGEVK